MPRTEVVIVGAGAAGLSAEAALKHAGVAAIARRDDRVGGSWARRYERLHLHTVRRFSGLAHHPIPRSYPRYVHKDQYAAYLAEYAAAPSSCGSSWPPGAARCARPTGGWETVTGAGRAPHVPPVVIVATGHYNEPVVPRWPGLDDYTGRVVHSKDYPTGRDFAGQAVLVVGIGNSGAEIAADLVEQGAARVAISVRTPPPIMPRELLRARAGAAPRARADPGPAPRLLDRVGRDGAARGDRRPRRVRPRQGGVGPVHRAPPAR